MRRVAVFASREEIDTPEAFAAAHQLGRLLGDHRMTLIVQAPLVGPTATVTDATQSAGGRILVVSTAHVLVPGDAEVRLVPTDDHARAEIGNQAEGFVVLPGGIGSLEAALALWTWAADRPGDQPLGFFDDRDSFGTLLKQATDEAVDRFARESQRGQLVVSRDPADLLRRLVDYRAPETRRSGTPFEDD